jgi:hypothetical protein
MSYNESKEYYDPFAEQALDTINYTPNNEYWCDSLGSNFWNNLLESPSHNTKSSFRTDNNNHESLPNDPAIISHNNHKSLPDDPAIISYSNYESLPNDPAIISHNIHQKKQVSKNNGTYLSKVVKNNSYIQPTKPIYTNNDSNYVSNTHGLNSESISSTHGLNSESISSTHGSNSESVSSALGLNSESISSTHGLNSESISSTHGLNNKPIYINTTIKSIETKVEEPKQDSSNKKSRFNTRSTNTSYVKTKLEEKWSIPKNRTNRNYDNLNVQNISQRGIQDKWRSNPFSPLASRSDKRKDLNNSEIIFGSITDKYIYGKINSITIIIMKSNGYVNATKLCSSNKKEELKYWMEKNEFIESLKEISSIMGISEDELIINITEEKNKRVNGLYFHHDLIKDLTRLINTQFKNIISRIINVGVNKNYIIAPIIRKSKKSISIPIDNDESHINPVVEPSVVEEPVVEPSVVEEPIHEASFESDKLIILTTQVESQKILIDSLLGQIYNQQTTIDFIMERMNNQDLCMIELNKNVNAYLKKNDNMKNIFVSCQQTKRIIKELNENKYEIVRTSCPHFNICTEMKLKDELNGVMVDEYDIPVYGMLITKAIYNIFKLPQISKLCNELKIPAPKFKLNLGLQSKANDVLKISSFVKEKYSHDSDIIACAVKIENFIKNFQLLKSIRNFDEWNKFIASYDLPSNWFLNLKNNNVLQLFGFSDGVAKNIRHHKLSNGATLEKTTVSLLSKLLAGYNIKESLTDIINLIHAVLGKTYEGYPTEIEIMETVNSFCKRIENNNFNNLWIPDVIMHDAERDDMLSCVILLHLNKNIKYIVQLPSHERFDPIEKMLQNDNTRIIRDNDSKNGYSIMNNFNIN